MNDNEILENGDEELKPLYLTDNETGMRYELDFNADSLSFAENRDFRADDIGHFPVTKIPELWYYAFRMHHRNLSRTQTDALLKKVGGLTQDMAIRLAGLYAQAQERASIFQSDDAMEKNTRMTVEIL